MRSINLWRDFIIESVVGFNGPWCLYDFISAKNNRHNYIALLSLAAGSHLQVDVFNYRRNAVSLCGIS